METFIFCLVMPMYNLIEYSNNYSGTARSLWQFKNDEQNISSGNPSNVSTADSSSLKYKSSLIEERTTLNNNGVFKT